MSLILIKKLHPNVNNQIKLKIITIKITLMLLDIVKTFLNTQKWQFSPIDDKGVLFFGINGKNGNFQCVADIREDEFNFGFFSICGVNTPKDKMTEMLNLINILNYGRFIGNFEMNYFNGEVRFRTSIFYKSITPNMDLVESLIMLNIIAMDSCHKAIMGVMFEGLTAIR